jgi:2,3-diketo-5-methylthio-1-phosphopentane phosphatase
MNNDTHQVVLLDIEGTTTPISFVYETLFPFAREHVAGFLRSHGDDPAVLDDLVGLAQQAEEDVRSGISGANTFEPTDMAAAIENVRWQMDNDRKTTALKSLQGKIWRAGYADGTLKGDVFQDVPGVMRRLGADGVSVCIYSSGSVEAQKLLFGHSTAGDLTGLIDAYFDTTTGPKKVSDSYRAIAKALGVPTADILFATDNLDEARAAREAGVDAVILDRPGNADPGPHDFPVWKTLEPAS